jgi:hypothetical protein
VQDRLIFLLRVCSLPRLNRNQNEKYSRRVTYQFPHIHRLASEFWNG